MKMAFEPLVKGTPNWHEKYNTDLASIDSQLENMVNIKEMTLYSASMNSGYSGSILYGLDAVGTVWIFLRGIKHTDGSSYTSGLDRMTIIPVGYRPKAIWAEAVSFLSIIIRAFKM